jgi:hypothetical protein
MIPSILHRVPFFLAHLAGNALAVVAVVGLAAVTTIVSTTVVGTSSSSAATTTTVVTVETSTPTHSSIGGWIVGAV